MSKYCNLRHSYIKTLFFVTWNSNLTICLLLYYYLVNLATMVLKKTWLRGKWFEKRTTIHCLLATWFILMGKKKLQYFTWLTEMCLLFFLWKLSTLLHSSYISSSTEGEVRTVYGVRHAHWSKECRKNLFLHWTFILVVQVGQACKLAIIQNDTEQNMLSVIKGELNILVGFRGGKLVFPYCVS